MSESVRAALLAKTKGAAAKGGYELFKIRGIFDSTVKNPERRGKEPEHITELIVA